MKVNVGDRSVVWFNWPDRCGTEARSLRCLLGGRRSRAAEVAWGMPVGHGGVSDRSCLIGRVWGSVVVEACSVPDARRATCVGGRLGGACDAGQSGD